MPSCDCPMAESRGGTTDERILALERELGARLPEDYREFLRTHNGGEPVRTLFHFTGQDGRSDSSVISRFNLQGEIEGITAHDLIPRDMIPMAIDPIQNRIVLVVSGPDTGKVFSWSWGEEPETPTCSRKSMRPLADSFDELLSLLRAD